MDEESELVVAPDEDSPADLQTASSSPPALNEAERLAMTIVAALDVIASRLDLETPHPKTARRVRGSRTVPPEFVASMIAAVETEADFQSFRTFDPEEARQVMQSREALRIVAERMAMVLAKVNYTMEARWTQVAAAAVQTFTLADILAKHPANAELAIHVESLRRLLGRTNKPKKEKAKKPKMP